jgi:hypothetical protein
MAFINNQITFIGDNRDLRVEKIVHNSANSFISVTDSASLYGYTSGGQITPGVRQNVVDRFSFSTDADAIDVGDMSSAREEHAGQSSSTHGYSSGGAKIGSAPGADDTIDKFPFASSSFTATDVGNLTVGRNGVAGQYSKTHGYTTGGRLATGSPTLTESNVIDNFPFSADSNATDVGDLIQTRGSVSGQNSSSHGYTSGGFDDAPSGSTILSTIDKFSFASSLNNAESIGSLSVARHSSAGHSSETAGYASGGVPATLGASDVLDKFPFATVAPVTAVTSLTNSRAYAAGQSSFAFGYHARESPISVTNINKFSFATDGDHSSVGNLSVERLTAAGQNV